MEMPKERKVLKKSRKSWSWTKRTDGLKGDMKQAEVMMCATQQDKSKVKRRKRG